MNPNEAPAPSSAPGQVPTPAPNGGMVPLAPKRRLSKIQLGLIVAAVAIVGAVVIVLTHAGGGGYGYQYNWFKVSHLEENTYKNGPVVVTSSAAFCYDYYSRKSYLVCHENGLQQPGSINQRVWVSDPTKNSSGLTLTRPTWFGPYTYEAGNQIGYSNYGLMTFTGQYEVCFQVQDRTAGSQSASVYVDVVNHNPVSVANQLTPVGQAGGQLSATYKNGFYPLCVKYYHNQNLNNVEYRVYVRSGKVAIDYLDVYGQTQSPVNYTPYYYGYNPNPAAPFSKYVAAKQLLYYSGKALPTQE